MNNFSKERSYRGELVLRHLPEVRTLVKSLPIQRPALLEFEDLVSYGIIGLLKAIDRFEPGQGVRFRRYAKYWILCEVLNVIYGKDWLYCEHANREADWQESIDNQELSHERAELRALLPRAVRNLPPRHRMVIDLHYVQGVSMNRIAQMLKVSPSRASQLHVAAVNKLRSGLTGNDEGERSRQPRLWKGRACYNRRPGEPTLRYHRPPSGSVESPIELKEVERQTILSTLASVNGVRRCAAKVLGIGETSVYRKVRKYGIRQKYQRRRGRLEVTGEREVSISWSSSKPVH